MTTALATREDVTYHPAIDAAEARRITDAIRSNMTETREMVLRMWQMEGWRCLGYESFNQWAINEFDSIGHKQVYRIKDAAMIDASLGDDESPIKVSWASHLKSIPADDLPDVMAEARSLADAEGRDEPVGRHVKQAAETYMHRQRVRESDYRIVQHMMSSGDVTPKHAATMCDSLDRMAPDTIAYLGMLMKVGLGESDPALLRAIASKYEARRNGHESKVLTTIEATHTIAQTPLSKATLSDLKRANQEANQEYKDDAIEAKKQKAIAEGKPLPPEPVAMNAWKRDPQRTLDGLIGALSSEDMEALFKLMAQQRGYRRCGGYDKDIWVKQTTENDGDSKTSNEAIYS